MTLNEFMNYELIKSDFRIVDIKSGLTIYMSFENWKAYRDVVGDLEVVGIYHKDKAKDIVVEVQ